MFLNFTMQTSEKDTPDTPGSLPDIGCYDDKNISKEYTIINQEQKKVNASPLFHQQEDYSMDLMCDESGPEDAEFSDYDDTDLESENMSEDELNEVKYSLFSNAPRIDMFSLLSDEIILLIFKFLPRWVLVKCALVCKRWKKISYDKFLWSKYNMGERVVKYGALESLFSRGVIVLRLATSEIKYPIFSPGFLLEPRLSSLQYLDLGMASVSPEGLAEILSVCVNLKKLSLESCLVNYECLKNVSNYTKLSVLNLTMCRGVTAPGLRAIFVNCINLTELNCAWIRLDSEEWLSVLPYIPVSIRRLNVSGHKETFNNECLFHVINRCQNLVELDISDCRSVYGKGFEALARKCLELEHLHCSRSYSISSDCYRLLKQLPKFKSLDIFNTLLSTTLDSLRKELPHVEVNKHVFSTIARPTTGKHMYSIWGIRTREGFD